MADFILATNTKLPSIWFSTRIMVMYLGCIAFFISYMMRIGLSIVIVETVNVEVPLVESEDSSECPSIESSENSTTIQKEFDWSQREIGYILGAYFIGYTITQIPYGWFSVKYGGKWSFGLGICGSSLGTVITPFVARRSVHELILLRLVCGLVEGSINPAYTALVSQWAPMTERSQFMSIAQSGNSLGIICGSIFAGYLCTINFAGGWPLVFYTVGGFGVVWFAIFCFTVYSFPKDHPRLSKDELEYLKQHVSSGDITSTPWCKILRSTKFWAFVFGNCAGALTQYVMLSCIPLYLGNVLKFKGTSNGLVNALPYVAKYLSEIFSPILTDNMLKQHLVTITTARKVNCFIGVFFPALLFFCLGYVGCDKTLAVTCLIVAMAAGGFVKSGAAVNTLDLAPSYAGTVYAMGNTFAQVCGFIAPVIMSNIVNENPESILLWRYTLVVFSSFLLIFGLVFVVFGTGETQPWGITQMDILSERLSDSESSTQFTSDSTAAESSAAQI